jgi:hypothetical protein
MCKNLIKGQAYHLPNFLLLLYQNNKWGLAMERPRGKESEAKQDVSL